jgi:formate hydrogenlyase transcriptional activator
MRILPKKHVFPLHQPLINRERAIGALMIASRREAAFTQLEADLLSQIANQIATAVDNAIAFRQIAELSDKLKQEKRYLEEEINLDQRFEDIVGESAGLKQVLKETEKRSHITRSSS